MFDFLSLCIALQGAKLLTWWRALPDRACIWLAQRLPRRLIYFAGARVLDDITRERALSNISRYFDAKEIRMWWALETWINRRR